MKYLTVVDINQLQRDDLVKRLQTPIPNSASLFRVTLNLTETQRLTLLKALDAIPTSEIPVPTPVPTPVPAPTPSPRDDCETEDDRNRNRNRRGRRNHHREDDHPTPVPVPVPSK